MQGQPNETVEEQGRRTEQTILTLVLSGGQRIWSVEEMVSEIGRRLEVVDSLAALQAAGLVHRCQDFVFATRAALRFDEMDL
jgi:predicted DCC family thiol-disulfide oxidoreductase YuxK